jgi:hypothetical protein
MKAQSLWVAILFLAGAAVEADTVLFQENFESGNLNQWASGHHGVIVADPLHPTNHVLTFTALNAGGDIFTAATLPVSDSNRLYILKFDYLGVGTMNSGDFGLGGFIGLWVSGTEPHYWVAGTTEFGLNTPWSVLLRDDGVWYHYEIEITPLIWSNHLTQVYLMLEDWISSGGIPGDAYFDNVQLVARGVGFNLEDLVPCAGPLSGGMWKNHGRYVSTVARETRGLVAQGIITPTERVALVRDAARSSCGKKNNQKRHN